MPCGVKVSPCVLFSAVTFVPVSKVNGQAEADDILAAVRPATCLVTIMLANNETGVVMVSGFLLWEGERSARALGRPPPSRLQSCNVCGLSLSPSPDSIHSTFIRSKQHTQLSVFPPQPVPEISRRVKALNQERVASGLPVIFLHTDAAQALGKRRVDVEDLGVDFLTVVGHKVCAQGPPALLGGWRGGRKAPCGAELTAPFVTHLSSGAS